MLNLGFRNQFRLSFRYIISTLKETISTHIAGGRRSTTLVNPHEPQFGAEPIMEVALLRSFMAFTFNYDPELKHQVYSCSKNFI